MTNQWKKIRNRNVSKLLKVAADSFIAATQSVSFKSPVDKGTFINNWFTEINGFSSKITDATDKTGQARLSDALNISKSLKIGDSISFANNLPYAIPLEYGHSAKAKDGMVRLTAAQWPLIVKQVTRGVK